MRLFPGVTLKVFVTVLDHDDDSVDHRSNGDSDAPKRHDVCADALPIHDRKCYHHGNRQDENRHERASEMHQEQNADDSDDDAFFNELFFKCSDGAIHERAPVISNGVAHIGWQPFHCFIQPLFDIDDDLLGVRAITHDHDPPGGLAIAVEFRYAAAHIGTELPVGALPQQNGHAVLTHAGRHFLQILDGIDIATHA